MANIEIKHLLRINRLPESDASLILFLLYSPVGLFIFILRAILLLGLFILGQVLPDTPASQKIINKIACLSLGISVSIENPRKKDNVDVYISNSLSIFDQLAVCSATGSVSPSARTSLEKVMCLSTYCFGNVTNSDNFKNSVSQFMAEKKTPLYFAPEGRATNGKALLKFKTYAFEVSSKIQPICITIERSLLDISVTTLGSSYFSDLFYFMFCPLTIYKLKFLPSLERKSTSNSDFAEIVRREIATNLKIEMTDYTSNDLIEWEKRKLAEDQQRAQRNANRPVIPEIQRMSYQVKEVLPHVPYHVIYNDLCVTRNVDSTITNILEGRLHFTPEQTSVPNAHQSSQPSPTVLSHGHKAFSTKAASSFPKSAIERSKSFQERKEQLIANARKRFIKKHNLDIPV
ncbi:lipid droplet-regulating VLDL assembly factor AUP1 [Leptinotarsa decemlineata]|uniref:lipid droplet-regulating VLDL assembly factor AUP1 n=1 Tax=Leptinotarsa decemlineata TaxID=7539 RepID=UPI003D306E74